MELVHRLNQAQAAYARCIDNGELESWPDFFAEKCLYRLTTADNYRRDLPGGMIHATSRAMLRDRVIALRQANIYERHVYRHLLGQALILEQGAGVLRSETAFMAARIMRDGSTDIFATGRYLDRYDVTEDTLLLAERIVVCDSSRIDTLLALPL